MNDSQTMLEKDRAWYPVSHVYSPLTKNFFRVIADHMGAKSEPSNIATATTLAFPAPGDLRAVSIAARSIDLAWTSSSSFAIRYAIEQTTGASPWTACDTVWAGTDGVTVSGLQPSTDYSFRVCGLREAAVSPYSNVLDVRTRMFLPTPTNFRVSVQSTTEVLLNWLDNATGETGYEVEQRSPLQPWLLVETTGPDATSYARTNLTPDSTFFFRVRAVGDNAASDWSEECSVKMSAPPAAPLGLVVSALDYNSVRLSWKRGSPNVTTHEIDRREGGGVWTTAMSVAGSD
ncbi:MAG: fibronectin type III domain-containing protein, partial [Bacteroidetes bacterium]|nr:fibronectin type III domain-containing protein [Bacteroidota bacterium]